LAGWAIQYRFSGFDLASLMCMTTAPLANELENAAASIARPWWRPWRAVLGGFLVAFLVGLVCAEITKSFGDWNHGFQWEADLMLWIHRPLPGWLDLVVLTTPWFGTNLTLIPVIAGLSWWLWKRWARPDLTAQLITVQLGSYLLNPSLKALFERDRPSLFERRGWYAWSSYPSGHAIASVSVLLTVAIVLYRAKGWRWPFYLIVPIVVAAVYSRIYLGVHWPTDVFAGSLVGGVWLVLTIYAFRDRRTTSAEDLGETSAVDVAPADDRRNSLPIA
jgi:membrane-associated phospholipid phosphatase